MALKWKIQNPWYISFASARRRCNDPKFKYYSYYGGKGIKFLMTLEDFKFLWFRDKAYLMKKPTIDRKDSNGHYELHNCQFIENVYNIAKARMKTVLQYDLNGRFIKEFKSTREVERKLGFNHSGISYCCLGKFKQSYNFIWKYKERLNEKKSIK